MPEIKIQVDEEVPKSITADFSKHLFGCHSIKETEDHILMKCNIKEKSSGKEVGEMLLKFKK